MKLSLQDEILKKYPMFGIDSSLPSEGVQPGLAVPDWVNEGPLYEIFIRNFTREGSFAAAEKRLPYLKDLGIMTIWLMPIHPIGNLRRKGTKGSPYAISDHKEINPDYGTKKQFRHLIDAIHDYDMHVIIDMVLNHGARDHVQCTQHPEMFNQDAERSPAEWSDIIEFDYRNEQTTIYSREVLRYWIEEFKIDGYRCDVAGLVPLEFWQNIIDDLLNLNPEIFLLAEWESRVLHHKSFHATYDWTMYLLMKDVYKARRSPAVLFRWFEEQQKTFPVNALHFRFTENHDLPRTTQTFGQERLYPYIFFLFSIPGIPLVYNGQEFGDSKLPSLFEHDPIDWEERNYQIFKFFKRLIHLRNTYDVFRCGNIEIIQIENYDQILAMRKRAGNKQYDFYLNFSSSEYPVNFDRNHIKAKSVRELMGNTMLTMPDEFVLRPFQSSVFEYEQYETSNS